MYVGQILTIVVLIVINGYLAAAEIALVSARRTALQAAADKGSSSAKAALRLLDDPNRLLSTLSVAITLVGFGAASIAAVTFEAPLGNVLRGLGIMWVTPMASGLAVFVVTIAVAYLTSVFGELAPKRLGLQRSTRVAQAVAVPVRWLSVVLLPLVWILDHSTDVVARLLGVQPEGTRPAVSEEEIQLLVQQQGTLLEEEKRMIGEVFDLGDTVAREIMVPRVDAVMIEDTLKISDALVHFRRTGFSRIPVFHEDPDTIVGLALLKDLLEPMVTGEGDRLVVDSARPPHFVPETKPILDLLQEMRSSHNHMVVVVDEHGGTAGIVTIEDIVEEIVGEIADEFDPDYRYVDKVGEGDWLIDGRLPVTDARAMLGLDVPESEEYDTVAGWVLAELGHIPVVGEHVVVGDAEVRVQIVRRRRVARLRVKVEQPAGTGEVEGDGPREAIL